MTLVEELKSIDEIADGAKADKEQLTRNLLYEWEQKHPLVNRALKGDFSFSDLLDELLKKYSGRRAVLPRLRDDKYDAKLDDLDLNNVIYLENFKTESRLELFPKHPYLNQTMDWISDMAMNPVVAGLFFGSFMTAFEAVTGGENYVSPFSKGMLMGGIVGLLGSTINSQFRSKAKDDAQYLDAKIQVVYQTSL